VQNIFIVRDANNGVLQTLVANFHDTWRVALGANYKLSDTWKLKAGTAFDQGAASDATTRLVSLPDNDRVWLSFGAQWSPRKDFDLDAGYAYVNVRDADINNDQRSFNRGLVSGTYSSHISILSAQATYKF